MQSLACKEGESMQILLHIHYSPPEENYGHGEALVEQVYSSTNNQLKANLELPCPHFLENAQGVKKV